MFTFRVVAATPSSRSDWGFGLTVCHKAVLLMEQAPELCQAHFVLQGKILQKATKLNKMLQRFARPAVFADHPAAFRKFIFGQQSIFAIGVNDTWMHH